MVAGSANRMLIYSIGPWWGDRVIVVRDVDFEIGTSSPRHLRSVVFDTVSFALPCALRAPM